jgi:Fe-Mn family superoxide dismutase
MERRKFLRDGLFTTAGSMTVVGGLSMLQTSCKTTKGSTGSVRPGTPEWQQMPLGYGYNALEPFIDMTTMDIHYNRHAAAYTKNMNEAADAEAIVKSQGLESLLATVSKFSVKFRNNAGGHYNHESFWKWMTPGGKPISPTFAGLIEKSFGSLNDMKNQFNSGATQRFGSGWAWLILDKQKQLKITSTPNQDNPLMDVAEVKGYPLLGLDVWEHAYYLKYQNKRADYIAAWWNIVNWAEVESRYNWAIKLA